MTTMEQDPNHDEPTLPAVFAGLRQSDPFRVPEGFFERFPHQVQHASVAQDKGTSEVPTRRMVWKWALAVLPALAVALWWAIPQKDDNGIATVERSTQQVAEHQADLWVLEQLPEHDLRGHDEMQDLMSSGLLEGLPPEYLSTYLEHEEIPLELLIEIL